jgi:hypothetical protein
MWQCVWLLNGGSDASYEHEVPTEAKLDFKGVKFDGRLSG